MFRANPERTGVYPSGGPAQAGGVVWKFQTDDTTNGISGRPAVYNGVVYFEADDFVMLSTRGSRGGSQDGDWLVIAGYRRRCGLRR
jgi:hypothetical protein